ncbi:MAG: hypothetical protein WCH43_02675 [Verrucomicrobiota bacterium]
MVVNSTNQPTGPSGASIFLDYGADGEKCDDKEIRLCERGMCFKSRWQFELGAELAIALTYQDRGAELQRANLHGIIAGCEKICTCCFEITLLFVDLPEGMQPVIAEISSRLKADSTANQY